MHDASVIQLQRTWPQVGHSELTVTQTDEKLCVMKLHLSYGIMSMANGKTVVTLVYQQWITAVLCQIIDLALLI